MCFEVCEKYHKMGHQCSTCLKIGPVLRQGQSGYPEIKKVKSGNLNDVRS